MSVLVVVVAVKTKKAGCGVERCEVVSPSPPSPSPSSVPRPPGLPPAAPKGETGALGWEDWVCHRSPDLLLPQLPASGRWHPTHLVVQARNLESV